MVIFPFPDWGVCSLKHCSHTASHVAIIVAPCTNLSSFCVLHWIYLFIAAWEQCVWVCGVGGFGIFDKRGNQRSYTNHSHFSTCVSSCFLFLTSRPSDMESENHWSSKCGNVFYPLHSHSLQRYCSKVSPGQASWSAKTLQVESV